MNLLAHVVLSPVGEPGVLVGNLTADWIKGRARHGLRGDLRAGVELHRRIDAFTDVHVLVGGCCSVLDAKWGRYSPVLVDIFFDHVLCGQWERHCAAEREAVIAGAYGALRGHLDLLPGLPQRTRMAAEALLEQDWLSSYATLQGIGVSLGRLSRRLKHEVELEGAVADFVVHRAVFEGAFAEFFPLLRGHVEQWMDARVD